MIPFTGTFQVRSFSRTVLGLVIASYIGLLIVAAVCTFGGTMPESHHPAHHDSHKTGLCAWACHVSQTSADIRSPEAVAPVLFLLGSALFFIHSRIRQVPAPLQPSRGPPITA